MLEQKKLAFGSVWIVKSILRAGVTHVPPYEQRYGRNLHLMFPVGGDVIVRSSPGTQDLVSCHDMAWLTNWKPYSLFLAAPATVVSVFVPSRILDESADSSYQLPVVGNRSLMLSAPVREFVRSLSDEGVPVDRLPSYLVEKLILEMTMSLILETQGMSRVNTTVEQGLHARAMAYISAYKTDSELTPAKLASEMNISLRQLQRAFAADGSSITDELRRQRAETAVGLLTDPAYRHLDLGQVADYAGFANRAELRRAIGAVHGCTPTQLRANGASSPDSRTQSQPNTLDDLIAR